MSNDDTPRWMATTATTMALHQLDDDLTALNEQDRAVIESAERRIKGRTRLLKRLRRYWRNKGLVNVGWVYGRRNTYVRREDIR